MKKYYKNATMVQGKIIAPVFDQDGRPFPPSMARDAHIVPNIAHDALLKPGLRLNPEAWER